MRVRVSIANQRVALGEERRALGSGAAMAAASAQYAACTPSRSLSGIARDPLCPSGVATFVCCALSVSQRTSAHPSVRWRPPGVVAMQRGRSAYQAMYCTTRVAHTAGTTARVSSSILNAGSGSRRARFRAPSMVSSLRLNFCCSGTRLLALDPVSFRRQTEPKKALERA